ncbi:MAG: hypothetical protein ACE5IW_07135 [bacterium]
MQIAKLISHLSIMTPKANDLNGLMTRRRKNVIRLAQNSLQNKRRFNSQQTNPDEPAFDPDAFYRGTKQRKAARKGAETQRLRKVFQMSSLTIRTEIVCSI